MSVCWTIMHDAYCGGFAAIDLREFWNILVVKLDHIGDWLLCTPFLDNLRRNAPQARITVVVRKPVLELAALCPSADGAIGVDDGWSGICGSQAVDHQDLIGFRRDFMLQSFDLAIVPRWDVDFDGAGRLARASGAPIVVGFSEKTTARKRLLNRGADRFYTHAANRASVAHEVEQNLFLLESMNGHVTSRRTVLGTTALDERVAERVLGSPRRPFLAIAPFASEAKRMLPLPRLATIVGALQRRLGIEIVILGAAADATLATALASSIGRSARSLCGRLTLRQTAAVIRRSALLIGKDSGLAHVAAAVETPVAVLSCHPYDGAADHPNSPRRFAPWAPTSDSIVLQPRHARQPCQEGCNAEYAHCIAGLETDVAIEVLGRFAERHLTSRRFAS
jgi:heptosyltransferase-2